MFFDTVRVKIIIISYLHDIAHKLYQSTNVKVVVLIREHCSLECDKHMSLFNIKFHTKLPEEMRDLQKKNIRIKRSHFKVINCIPMRILESKKIPRFVLHKAIS